MPANNPPTGSGFCSCLPKPPRNCRVSLPVPKGQRGETALAKELKTRDLIHKAVGWSLREAGKANENALLTFLDRYAVFMPRTMLRYSLERLVPDKRKHYMLLK
jgi:hypothetical protein